ncbi:16619_t:CDS:2, partial [Racocetra fulgida]
FEKVLAMSQLHSSILSKRKCEEIEKAEIQYKRICPEQSEDPETINDDIVDDPEDYWSCVIENWIDMVDAENHVDNEEIMDNEMLEFEFGGRIIHPAEDPSA